MSDEGSQPLPTAQPLPVLSREEVGDSIEATFRAILAERHPEVISGQISGGSVNLYVSLSGNGDVVETAVDTEPRSGSCSRIVEEGLGTKLDRERWYSGGCGGIDAGEAGPSRVAFFWRTAKPENEQERLTPTGPYLIDRLLHAMRPTPEQLADAVRRYFPDVQEAGLPQGENLWFVGDRYHRVVHAGRGWERASSAAAQAAIEEEIPGVALDGVLMTGIRSARDTPISIVWAALGSGSTAAASRPDPHPAAQIFAVTTAEAGREVEILLEGEAAADPSAFRVSGNFTNDGGLLTAKTPFSLIVLSDAPYRATLRLLGEGELRLETETQGERRRTNARMILLSRQSRGSAPQMLAADLITAQGPNVRTLPVGDPVRR